MKKNFDFRRKILIVFFIALQFILFNSCEHLLDSPSIPNEKTTVGGALSAPTGLKASQGLKRKISLSWNAVEGAKRYYIYMASNPNEEFVQVGETAEISYEIRVSPGTTDYYRVVAEKADGTRSPISAMSDAGASLALPVFSGADVDESNITVYWDMENASYYKEKLRFEVKQEDTATGITTSRFVSGNESYSCVFENLESNSKYVYSIDAYLEDTPDEKENSGKSTVATMALHRPQPPKFTVSEGEFKDRIRLNITLPPKVQVSITSDLGGIIETDYPVYFEVSRKRGEKGAYEVIEKNLYYDGSDGDEGAAAGYDGYVAGNTLVWDDKKFTEQDRGVKYEYKIKSYIDYNFLPQNGSPKTSSRESDTCTGWMSQQPKFTVKGGMSGEKYDVTLGIDWNAMGKENDYKFAIKLEKKNANLSDTGGEVSWLENGDGEKFFKTDVESLKETYTIDEKMYYYTLYVVKSQATIDGDVISEDDVLEAVAASPILVADLADLPTSNFSVDDGYPNKVVLNLVLDEGEGNSDVSYKFVRKLNGVEDATIDAKFENGQFADEGLLFGKKYEYVMYATRKGSEISVPSEPKEAMTLGKPEPNVVMEGDGKKKLAYDAIYLEMYEVFGAKSYCLTLGDSNGFGGGQTVVFGADGTKTSGEIDVSISLVDQKFAITINEPSGYDDAKLAGNEASLVVAARGYDGTAENTDKKSEKELKGVKVMGPAELKVSGTEPANVAENEITLKWNKVDDAVGYAIVRKRDGDAEYDVFYVDNTDRPKVSLADTTATSSSLCDYVFEVECDGSQYTFVDKGIDTYGSNDAWYKNQQKIAWGYEYTYTVLPLLEESDAGQMLGSGGAADFTVKYENLDVASGYTYGYGLDVKASKADYANKIKVSWDVPKYAREKNDATAYLYYRKINNNGDPTSDWTYYSKGFKPEIKDGKAEAAFIVEQPDDLTTQDAKTNLVSRSDVAEYAVRYTVGDVFKETYVQYLASTKEGSVPESINRGYCFALTGGNDGLTDVSDHKDYGEKLKWMLYDSKSRGVGPDGYRLYVKNNNLSDEWHKVATFGKDGKFNSAEETYGTAKESSNIQVTQGGISGNTVTTIVAPENTAELGGLLKVLRDYKHYYRIEAYRYNSEEVEIRTSIGGSGADYNTPTDDAPDRAEGYDYGDTQVKYAYRQITNEEMVRAATLAMTIGFKHARDKRYGVSDNDKWSAANSGASYTESGLGSGTVEYCSYKDRSHFLGMPSGDVYHKIIYKKYKPEMKAKSGENVSFLTIDAQTDNNALYGETWSGTAIDAPSEYHTLGKNMKNQDYIIITGPEETNGLYSGKLAFYWLDKSANPRYTSEEGYKGIKISYPNGSEEKVFGNITPLPFSGNGSASASFKQDSEEWQ